MPCYSDPVLNLMFMVSIPRGTQGTKSDQSEIRECAVFAAQRHLSIGVVSQFS